MTLGPAGDPQRVRFSDSIALTKGEAFEVCEACAHAEQLLRISGRTADAARFAGLVELIEGRLAII
jgi:hypothetical protein